jgi:hypothetical protein
MIEGARLIEFDTLDHALEYARDDGGRIWQGDDGGRIVWFDPRINPSTIPTHVLCRGRGFVGNWRESIERHRWRLTLH